MKRTLAIGIGFCLCVKLMAQTLSFQQFTLSSSANILISTKDSLGFLWLATDEGLVFYDGLSAQLVDEYDREITALTVAESKVWVGTENGQIRYYDALSRRFEGLLDSLGHSPIRNIFQRSNKQIITSYGSGLWIMDSGDSVHLSTENGLLSDDIYDAILEDHLLWVATDRGINSIDLRDIHHLKIDSFIELPDLIITQLEENESKIWAATHQEGLFYIDKKTKVVEHYPLPGAQNVLDLSAHENELLVLTEEALFIWSAADESFHLLKDLELMQTMLLDLENNLWVFGDGGHVLKSSMYFYQYPLNIPEIQSICSTPEGFWIGSEHGLYLADSTFTSVRVVLPNKNITTIHVSDRNVWVGTYTEGIYIYNREATILDNVNQSNGLGDNTVLDITNFDSSHVVASTLAGVYTIDDQFDANLLHESLQEHYVLSMVHQADKLLWLGTDRNGLIYYQDGSLEPFSDLELQNKEYHLGSVYSMTEYQDKLWLSSTEGGLLSMALDSFQFMQYDSRKVYTSLIPVDSERLLLINENGADLFNTGDHSFSTILDQKNAEDEPFLNNFTVLNQAAYFVLHDQIYEYRFRDKTYKTQPTIYIHRIEVNLDPIRFQQHSFRQRQNNFSFYFAGNWMSYPDQLHYEYRLLGFDENWRQTRDLMASYPHLLPGDYTFQVKISNGQSSNLDDSISQYSFSIQRSFWNSVWFYALIACLIYGLTYWIFIQRKTRAQLQAELSRKQMEAQFINLKSQINPHFLFNSFNTLIGLIEEDQKRSVSFTEKLTDYYRTILELGEKEWIPVEEELRLVRLYGQILKERYGDNISIHFDDNLKGCWLPPLSLQMLVENAVKHNTISSKQKLNIAIHSKDEYIVVQNSLNPKLTSELSTGIGLKNIRERLAHRTSKPMKIEKTSDEFLVYLPKIVSK